MTGIKKLRDRFSFDEAYDPSLGLGQLTLDDLRDMFSDGGIGQWQRATDATKKFDEQLKALSPDDRIAAATLYLMKLLQLAVSARDGRRRNVSN